MGIGFTCLGTLVVGVTGWNKVQNSIDALEKTDGLQWGVINAERTWRAEHEKEVAEKRLELEKDLSRLRENAVEKDGKLDAILDKLEDMKSQIERLQQKIN